MSDDKIIDISDIIIPSNRCEIDEAISWFKGLFKTQKKRYSKVCKLFYKSFKSNMDLEKIDDQTLDSIVMDLDFMSEETEKLKAILIVVNDAIKYPSSYDAYKAKVNDQLIYVITKKGSNKSISNIYI